MILKRIKLILVFCLLLLSIKNIPMVQATNDIIAKGGQPVYDKTVTISSASSYATGIASNGTHLFVTTNNLFTVLIYTINGKFIKSFGTQGSGPGQFKTATGIVYANNQLYVVDTGNNRTEIFTTNGDYVSQFGSPGSGNGQFNFPYFISADSTHLFIVDRLNHRIQIFDFNGNYVGKFGVAGSADNQFNDIWGVTVKNNRVYVTDFGNISIKVFTDNGTYLFSIKDTGESPTKFMQPFGITATNNFIYTSDYSLKHIFSFDLNGNFQSELDVSTLFQSQVFGMFALNDKLYTTDPDPTYTASKIVMFDLLSPPQNPSVFTGENSLTISWKGQKYETQIPIKSYIIYRSTDGINFNYFVETNNKYFIDQAVSSGTTYYYKIAAVAVNNLIGISDFSSVASAKFGSSTSSNAGFLPFSETAALIGIFTIVIIRYKKSRKR